MAKKNFGFFRFLFSKSHQFLWGWSVIGVWSDIFFRNFSTMVVYTGTVLYSERESIIVHQKLFKIVLNRKETAKFDTTKNSPDRQGSPPNGRWHSRKREDKWIKFEKACVPVVVANLDSSNWPTLLIGIRWLCSCSQAIRAGFWWRWWWGAWSQSQAWTG